MELVDFIVKAKINTYATTGEGGENTLEDGSKQLVFKEGEFNYRDRYFGSNPFIGEEIVFKNNKVIWGMNYYGKAFSNEISIKEIYEFLKKAMQKVSRDNPFRGPENFKEGNFEYKNNHEENLEKN